MTAKIYLSDSGGGNITIKKTTGQVYEGNEENVTGGTDLNLRIYGISASTALDDVTITAKTDKTGNATCGTEDLTVIWTTMSFRGSDHQDEDLDPNNASKFSDVSPRYPDKVGLQDLDLDSALVEVRRAQETNVTVAPNVVVPNVTWDVKREYRERIWAPGGGVITQSAWHPDDGDDSDEDLIQASGDLQLFSIDGPGWLSISNSGVENVRLYDLRNFREWVEVLVASKWYVASDYLYWEMKAHLRNAAPPPNWTRLDPNEVIPGNIPGNPDDWTQPTPQFTSITPNHGSASVNVTIKGINFETGTTTKLKRGATEISGTLLSITNSAQLTCSFDVTGQESGTKWDVVITTPYGGTVSATEAFTVD